MTGGMFPAVAVLLILITPAAFSTFTVGELQHQITFGPLAPLNVLSQHTVINSAKYTRNNHQFACGASDGLCSGWFYMPKYQDGAVLSSSNSSGKPPVIVMAHGLGGDKARLQRYAGFFADNGMAVFSFDYRCWGESSGIPRRWIDPDSQIEDWLSAVKHVQTNLSSLVDPNRISLWGTSFAGGHVITVASILGKQIQSVVSQVPHLDGKLASTANMKQRGVLGNSLLSVLALTDAATPVHGQHIYIPLAGPAGSLAIMQLDEKELRAYYDYKGLLHNSTAGEDAAWLQFTTRASLALRMSSNPYSPIKFVDKVTAPLLIVAGKDDALCPYSAAVEAQQQAPRATLLTFNCSHFDIYNAPYLQQAVSKELEFFQKHGV